MNTRLVFVASLIAVTISFFSSCSQPTSRSTTLFNDNWLFCFSQDDSLFSHIGYDDCHWQAVSLPHNAHPEPMVVKNQWQGICWYRKHFDIDCYDKEKSYVVKLEGAMNALEVWINGTSVRKDQGGYLPTVIDITEVVQPQGNVIAVRLDNRDNAITGPKPMPINGFNMYGGIYRNVWLMERNKIYISDPNEPHVEAASGGVFITYPKVSEELSEVSVSTEVVNELGTQMEVVVSQVIYSGEQEITSSSITQQLPAKGKTTSNITLDVQGACLWSPDAPHLYRLETALLVGNDTVDCLSTRFGIREFAFKENDLYINGVKSFLCGVNRHQEYPYVGYALSDNAQYRDAVKIKEGGFDYIRLCHYPQSDSFMDACDELGIVVIDAIMGWQYYNQDTAFQHHAFHSTRQLIRRDRNHPCVMAWEASLNETYMPAHFMERLNEVVHEESPYPNTYSCGWRHGYYDIFLQARQHRILHPEEMILDRPYSVSEYGDWEYFSDNHGFNQHSMSNNKRQELSSRQSRASGERGMLRQAYNVQEAHNDNLSTAAYSDSYWAMFDYNIGASQSIDEPGLMNILRLPKYAYYFYSSQRDMVSVDDCVLFIASYWDEMSSTDVRVYSNADEVELFLNGRSCGGRRGPLVDKNSTHLSHPPFLFRLGEYRAGELKAVAYKDGKKIKEQCVRTPQKAVALKCWVDESGKKPEAGCNDVVFVRAAAVDANGTLCYTYAGAMSFVVDSSMLQLMNTDGVGTEAGIASALVKVGEIKGDTEIEVSTADGLQGSVVMHVE